MSLSRLDRVVARLCFLTLALFWLIPLAIGSFLYAGGQYVLKFTYFDAMIMAALCLYFVSEMATLARKLVGSL